MDATNRNLLGLCGALVAAGALCAEVAMAASASVPLPKPRPAILAAKVQVSKGPVTKGPAAKELAKKVPATPVARNIPLPPKHPAADRGLSAFAQANVGLRGALFASTATFKPMARPASGPFALAPTSTTCLLYTSPSPRDGLLS